MPQVTKILNDKNENNTKQNNRRCVDKMCKQTDPAKISYTY